MKNEIKQVTDDQLCISKKPYGRGYRYYDEEGKVIKSKDLLKRLKKLVIPPMWSEVMICQWEDGHIQATGRDAKGRKQYIYHSKYEEARQKEKFARMKDFGQQVSKMRKANLKYIKQKLWTKEKVLSLVVMLLDETGVRIGNKQYAERNGTYGLTTLRRKHLSMDNQTVTLEYKGKSKQHRQVEVDDPQLTKLIKQASELPGYELFRYLDEDKVWQNVDSDEVNEWIRTHMGEKFSSKDFRTWVASRLAIELYADAKSIKDQYPRRKFTNILLRLVADELGNTPTICKSYYIHHNILQLISDQTLTWQRPATENLTHQLSSSEKYLLTCL